jgi:hypothetical protein
MHGTEKVDPSFFVKQNEILVHYVGARNWAFELLTADCIVSGLIKHL